MVNFAYNYENLILVRLCTSTKISQANLMVHKNITLTKIIWHWAAHLPLCWIVLCKIWHCTRVWKNTSGKNTKNSQEKLPPENISKNIVSYIYTPNGLKIWRFLLNWNNFFQILNVSNSEHNCKRSVQTSLPKS